MEGLILIFLVPIFWIVNKLLKKRAEKKANKEWDRWVEPYKKKDLPKDYLAGVKDASRNGKRGGRYETRISKKTGTPYRHYY